MKARSIFSIAAALFLFTTALVSLVNAQTSATGPQLVITWKATDSAAPINYQGKILPGIGSPITASVAAVSSGNFINLKPYTIYWYLDDNFLGGGVGKQTITFNAPGHAEIASLRADVSDYQGGPLINTAHIELASPKVVIVAPYVDGFFSQSTVSVHAAPYFWKTSNLNKLSFAWSVNGQAVTTQENPEDLIVNLSGATPAGYSLAINLAVQQSDDPLTSARASVSLTEANQ